MRIRDAVNGDVIFNGLEEHCIRHAAFQRLHLIKQLGNAFHVYPSAVHTRFEHSLGVSYQIKRLLSLPGFFPPKYKISKRKKNLIELAGLLHDIVHTPFKHTLDRDVAILPEPDMKLEYALRFEQLQLTKELGKNEIQLLLDILACGNANDLHEPYLRQMIEDTISADLLDYSRRDAYFSTGWGRQWDERIYDHIAVSYYNNKLTLAAKLTDSEGKITPSAITELVNLLQVRYLLNERVYFYPAKISADALLVKSIRCFLESSGKSPKELLEQFRDYSDEGLINHLKTCSDSRTRRYAELLSGRVLPGLAHSFSSKDLIIDDIRKVAYHCWGNGALSRWQQCEDEIAKEAKIDQGTVIIYCHDPKMQEKEPNFYVQRSSRRLAQPVKMSKEMESEVKAIAEKHRNLWRCHVFSLDRTPKALNRIKTSAINVVNNLKSKVD